MLKKSEPKFTLETIVERMRAGARRSRTGDETLAFHVSESQRPLSRMSDANQFPHDNIPPIVLQPSFQPRNDDHYHVNDLLKYHDRAFVQNAYRAILKRGPDTAGFNNFIEALRSGRLNKIDVLARLRYSTEGRAKQVRIAGLFLPAAIRLLYDLPLLGYLLNLLIGLARLPRSIRNEQQFQAHVLAQQEIIAEHANHLGEVVASLSTETARALSQSLQGLSEMHRQQIDTLKNEQTQRLEVRLAEMSERFEAAVRAQQAEAFSQLSLLSKRFEEALADEQSARNRGLNQVIVELESEQAAREKGLNGLTLALGDEQRAREKAFHTLFQRLSDESARLRTEAAMIEERLVALNEARRTEAELFATEVHKLFQKQQEVRAEMVLQGERVTRLLDEAGRRLTGPVESHRLNAFAEEADHALDAFYLSLENQFRGTRAEVKQRLRVYLPEVKEARVGRKQMPILDVGCGRGEWLELLSEEGFTASGVDSNRVMIQQCRELKLKAAQADLMDHLRSLTDASLGAITGFHIIEHLPVETLIKFLDETVRVVKPGGLVILETPNPQNVLVGSCNFYFDPTHRNPLPSPIIKFLLESRGYTGVKVVNLNPSDEAPVTGDSELVRRFNEYFYGPMDYAVLGRRP